jgi:hypothetical protein
MEVTRATADFYGGKADFKYLMAPLGKRDQPARAVFDVNYRDVDLNALTDFYETRGLRLAGRASGHNEMSWPLGRYAERRGSGTATFTSVGGLQGPQLAADAASDARDRYLIAGPFSTHTPMTPVAVTSRMRSIPKRCASSRAASSPRTPSSRSREPRPTASDRRCRSG